MNSKVVGPACNLFVAARGVHKKKLLGIGTGGQLFPVFVQGVSNLHKLRFLSKVAPCGAVRLTDEQIFIPSRIEITGVCQAQVLLSRSRFRISSCLASKMIKSQIRLLYTGTFLDP